MTGESAPPLDLDLDQLRALQQQPVAAIGRVQRVLRRRIDERLERFGVTGVQFGLLSLVAQSDGIAQTSLQQQMAIEGATLTQLLQRLERDGWLIRTFDRVDRRKQRVWLTDRGRGLLPAIADEVAQHRREVQQGFSDEELFTLGRLLARLEENARA
jgi:DNA-binding MarR family transcriptional regulator